MAFVFSCLALFFAVPRCSPLFYAEEMRFAGVMFGMGLGLMVAGVAGCRSLPPPMPLDQLNAQQARGHAVFQAKCGQCHYDRKDASLHGPPLLGVFKKPALPSGAPANDERVTATIEHGRGMMPAMGDRMDAGDLEDVLAYLHTL